MNRDGWFPTQESVLALTASPAACSRVLHADPHTDELWEQ